MPPPPTPHTHTVSHTHTHTHTHSFDRAFSGGGGSPRGAAKDGLQDRRKLGARQQKRQHLPPRPLLLAHPPHFLELRDREEAGEGDEGTKKREEEEEEEERKTVLLVCCAGCVACVCEV